MYFCIVFHGIRFKVSKDWLSGDNQFFLYIALVVINYKVVYARICAKVVV